MNKEQEKLLGTLIRDITKVGSVPKSDVRRRINEIRKQDKKNFIKRLEGIVGKDKEKKSIKNETLEIKEYVHYSGGYNQAKVEIRKRISNLIKELKNEK